MSSEIGRFGRPEAVRQNAAHSPAVAFFSRRRRPLPSRPFRGRRRHAAGRGETPRERQKNATSRGKPGVPGTTLGSRKTTPSAHEPLIRWESVADVPLAGLSFGPEFRRRTGPARGITGAGRCSMAWTGLSSVRVAFGAADPQSAAAGRRQPSRPRRSRTDRVRAQPAP